MDEEALADIGDTHGGGDVRTVEASPLADYQRQMAVQPLYNATLAALPRPVLSCLPLASLLLLLLLLLASLTVGWCGGRPHPARWAAGR